MKAATTLITEKRKSHTKKGHGYIHDTQHKPWHFLMCAQAYINEDETIWPFTDGFKLGDTIENLVNAGSMIAAAIDRMQRYEVGKIYEKTNMMDIGDRFKVLSIKPSKSGVWVYFVGVSGGLKPVKQSFMIGSRFDEDTIVSPNQNDLTVIKKLTPKTMIERLCKNWWVVPAIIALIALLIIINRGNKPDVDTVVQADSLHSEIPDTSTLTPIRNADYNERKTVKK